MTQTPVEGELFVTAVDVTLFVSFASIASPPLFANTIVFPIPSALSSFSSSSLSLSLSLSLVTLFVGASGFVA